MSDAVWLVTGSSRGLGNAMAREALERGHRVVVTSRRTDDLMRWESEFAGRCKVMALDVAADGLEGRAAEAEAVWGRIDVLVNNAGFGLIGALEECSMGEVRTNLETNFFGPMRMMKAVLPGMRERGSGHLVNVSAAAAIANYPGFSAYGAAKAALEYASEALKLEAAAFGVKVMLVEPGPFRTGFIGQSMAVAETTLEAYANSSGRFKRMLAGMDGKQVGDPAKAAKVIADLVEAGHSGLRVPLGKYAFKKVRDRAASVVRDVEAVEEAAAATDF